jgi:Mg-chelatase subunit ChlD
MKIFFTFIIIMYFGNSYGQSTYNASNNSKYKMLVSGKIVDYETKLPLDSVLVKVTYFNGQISDSAYSDANGVYQLRIASQIVVGNYPVRMSKKGYNTITGFMYLKDGLNHNHSMSKRVELVVDDTTFVLSNRELVTDSISSIRPLTAKEIIEKAPKNNFVFLIDVSGSMADEGKLDIVKSAIKYLVKQYREDDQVAIIVYSSTAKVVLPTTYASEKDLIFVTLESINTGGKTDGGKGLDLAYNMAKNHFVTSGNNKVVLATDGLFGTDAKQTKKMNKIIANGISDKIKLSILSFGKEQAKVKSDLEKMAVLGEGKHLHITSLHDAEQALINLAKE